MMNQADFFPGDPFWKPYRKMHRKIIRQAFSWICCNNSMLYWLGIPLLLAFGVWKSQKKSHSTLWAKQASFVIYQNEECKWNATLWVIFKHCVTGKVELFMEGQSRISYFFVFIDFPVPSISGFFQFFPNSAIFRFFNFSGFFNYPDLTIFSDFCNFSY